MFSHGESSKDGVNSTRVARLDLVQTHFEGLVAHVTAVLGGHVTAVLRVTGDGHLQATSLLITEVPDCVIPGSH